MPTQLHFVLMEVFIVISVFFAILLTFLNDNVVAQKSSFEAIYQFGDSISDTGNLVRQTPGGCGVSPYGETFFHYPTGRCSDGLLMVDYFAKAFNLPLLSPYLDKTGDFSHGVNFAVAGATALDTSFLARKNISATLTKSSLLVQLDWFKSYLNTSCVTPECNQKLRKALFVVGGIGSNDYDFAALGGKSPQELRTLVPSVVQTISNFVKEVINLGATRILVPGNFPSGCTPIYLSTFNSSDPTAYDELGCLKIWNDLPIFHNNQLQAAIKSLQLENPKVVITYGDYYSAIMSLLQDAPFLGFDKDGVLKACCGAGNVYYNFDVNRFCGTSGFQTCPNPNAQVSWDGIHLTQHAYQYMAEQLLKQFG